jgi:transcription-repair coupling factor (superfamily II helicase)
MKKTDQESFVSPFQIDLTEEKQFLKNHKHLTLVNLGNIGAKTYVLDQLCYNESSYQNIFLASTDEQFDQILSVSEVFFRGNIFLIPENFGIHDFYRLRRSLLSQEKTLFLFENFSTFLTQKFPSEKQIQEHRLILEKGKKINIFDLFAELEDIGYTPAKDEILVPGEFVRKGDTLFVYPENEDCCFRVEFFGDEVEQISVFVHPNEKEEHKSCTEKKFDCLHIFPKKFVHEGTDFGSFLETQKNLLFVNDDLDTDFSLFPSIPQVLFTTFPQEGSQFFHLNFFSVLPFYTVLDFIVDTKERLRREFEIVIMTKRHDEVVKMFRDNEIMFTENLDDDFPSTVKLLPRPEALFLPHSFQNNDKKIILLTDREIFKFSRFSRQKKAVQGINFDLMTSLKPGDFVVHTEHGIAQFDGIVRRDLGEDLGTREYLKLCYAGDDKLFVPVESAEKITKFIGDDNPRLTRLGGVEWQKSKKKMREEAEKIAKELLNLYAKRKLAKGRQFTEDDPMMKEFCDSFPYELTPGQKQAWQAIRMDMEAIRPMDRLLCGDVGFGKTEMAMRAAFKCFRSGYQAAILAPITILAEQHYQSFVKRIEGKNYGLRVALLSRFQTAKEQKDILSDLQHGLVDIIIGTHRLLSDDVAFDNLGLIIIDEEQRFGVQQKEKLKKLRASVDILTMTATPIPRTLNMSLNKLKDIATITTPPPGRLPVITEVRKYGPNLIRDRILHEIERGGQVYFLHNKVLTIEAQAEYLRALVPEASFVVAHGQLSPDQLEERIRSFKNGEYNVLVASTIIENGIDLPNANTLIVNEAEKFGLSQLYQLRGRVGRRRTQAYAYFLYHGQKLELEAKKRLRAIVEASELGSGFQIAMRDMEIRGAGEVLGASQSGAMKTVGISHFMRMLNKTVEEMKSGEVSTDIEKEEENITVEIPISAYIPSAFIPNVNEKIQVYKELSSAETYDQLDELQRDLREDYGTLPREVENLCKVIRLKILLREVHIGGIKVNRISHNKMEIVLRLGQDFTPDQIFGLIQKSPNQWTITANALKLQISRLAITWYEDLVKDIRLLKVDTQSPKKPDQKKK